MNQLSPARSLLLSVLLAISSQLLRAAPSASELEFFEREIRPLLVERCYKCHSAQSEKLKGGLRLDTRESVLKGGDTGPAIVPGDPERSRLIEAIRYANVDLQMPPKGKLSDQQIEHLITWIKNGAAWPADDTAGALSSTEAKTSGKPPFDLNRRRQEHWAWQPIQSVTPPTVVRGDWVRTPVDQFILAKLETAHLQPAVPADKRTLIRRAAFDLTGMPPTPAEVETFLRDDSSDAFAKIVDRYLASSAFGERWARHWLDLVRYAETSGHEFDYPIYGAWRYRDYVIRAFNLNLPADQFVMEHLAGDILPNPRRNPADGSNEAVIGTAFYWLGQQSHSPVDLRVYQADLVDNQIDVVSKAFLGVTVACARCHDHKFDAISTKDYYALYGIFESSRYTRAAIDDPAIFECKATELRDLKQQIRAAVANEWLKSAPQIEKYLLASRDLVANHTELGVAGMAASMRLNEDVLGAWVKDFKEPGNPADAMAAWRTAALGREKASPGLSEGHGLSFSDWARDGFAFQPVSSGDFIVGDNPAAPIRQVLSAPCEHSATLSRRFQGILRSPTFTITNDYIHVLGWGRSSRLNVCIDNYTLIRAPIYGGLKKVFDSDEPKWVTVDVKMWKGHRAYLEFNDTSPADPADEKNGYGAAGYIAFEQIVFSDDKKTGSAAIAPVSAESDPQALARIYQAKFIEAINHWAAGKNLEGSESALLDWIARHNLLPLSNTTALTALIEKYHQVEGSIPEPTYVSAIAEGTGLNEQIFIRGSPKNLGEEAPRRFLEALDGSKKRVTIGSGRLDLARQMIAPENPLLARVLVNQVWHHLFGRGIVASVDNLGVLGERPSHPELLDWLAENYRRNGWNTKQLIRGIMLSSTYQMSSRANDPAADEADPANAIFHRAPIRRLEGEAIRDAILKVSGKLNPKMFGPPVPVYLTAFMDGRGKPGQSGPIDGEGRRSVYQDVRRNFLSPFFLAFDTPLPFTTVGRRNVSNVPAQALIMMNDPFVIEQARHWAARVCAQPGLSNEEKIRQMYAEAFSRPPNQMELDRSVAFLANQTGDDNAWADYAHVLFNTKEFIFLN